MLAPAGEVYQAGTLSGNPLAVAAGIATLELLDELAYVRLSSLTTRLADGLRAAAEEASVPVQVTERPGLLSVFFSERPVTSFEDARAATWRPTRAGAGSCSRAGSTRRRRSSRPGSPRWPTPRSTSSAPSGRRGGVRVPARRAALVSVSRRRSRRRAVAAARAAARARRAVGGTARARIRRTVAHGGPSERPRWRPPDRAPTAGARSTSCCWRRSTRATCCTTASRACCAPPEADLGLLAGDQLYAIGLARLVELGDTEAVGELADTITLSALAQAADASSWPRRCGGPVARRGLGLRRPSTARQGAGARGLAGGARCDAHKRAEGPGAALSRASILFGAGAQTSTREQKSKYTSDRGIPGAFEGETVTRRRFMVGGASTAGGIAAAAFVLPALGSRSGRSSRATARWESGRDRRGVHRVQLRPGRADARTRTSARPARRPCTCASTTPPSTPTLRARQAVHRDLQSLRAPRLPGALGGRRRALHLPLPRRRVRPARPSASAVPRCARWTASTRA